MNYQRTGITYGPAGEQKWKALFECPTDGCEARHNFKPEPVRCTSCGAVIEPEIVARVVREDDSTRDTADEQETEDDEPPKAGGFEEPFAVAEHFAKQKVV